MTNLFLKAKHWQIFLITVGVPLVLQLVFTGLIISSIVGQAQPDPNIIFNYFSLLPIIMLVFMGSYFGWFWSVAIGLQKYIPEHIAMNVTRFKIFFFIPLIYIISFIFLFSYFMNQLNQTGTIQDPSAMGGWIALVFPLHFFAMFCIFFSIYFAAKTIKTAELQKEVSFGDFAGEFFMIWFYPIGIWIIQPKINKIYQQEFSNMNHDILDRDL